MTKFERVRAILTAAVGDGQPGHDGHGKFWNLPLEEVKQLTIFGERVVETEGDHRGARSALVKALKGEPPFDDSGFGRMPLDRPAVAPADIAFVEQWIDGGALDEPETPEPDDADRAPALARIRWEPLRAATTETEAFAAASTDVVELPAYLDNYDLLFAGGVPRAAVGATPKQEAVFLLKAAAEIEHMLLVHYLYAAYSLDTTVAGLPIDLWEMKIARIAQEEMGHLLTVQNLLALLGEPPHLDRETAATAVQLLPFATGLAPLTRASLGDYVIAESPVTATLPPPLDALSQCRRHVGAVYAVILWLFRDAATAPPPASLPGVELPEGSVGTDDLATGDALARLTTAADWIVSVPPQSPPPPPSPIRPVFHIDAPQGLEDARAALRTIASQGEGPLAQPESHFELFLGIHTALVESGTEVALAVPTNPTYGPDPLPDPSLEENRIANPTSALAAALFDARYHALVLAIRHALAFRPDEVRHTEAVRGKLAKAWAVGEMRRLKRLALVLAGLPRGDAGPRRAGAPFTPARVALPSDEREAWHAHLDLIARSSELVSRIREDAARPQALDALLAPIVAFDNARTTFINQVLGEI
jgi:hypothetical protein